MIDSRPRHQAISFLLRCAPPMLVAAAFVHGAASSWLKWGDLIIDTGRELQLPQRMLAGEALYSDLRYYYGPLSPYLNMVLYRIYGVRVEVLAWAGISSAALMCLGLYRLTRNFLGSWPSATVAASFVYLCAFAHLNSSPIFNFVLPYSYASTYGIVAATWSVHWLVLHIRRKVSAHFLLSVACLVLAAFTKPEILLAASAAHAAFLVSARTERQLSPKLHLSAYGIAAVLVVGIYGSLAAQVGPGLWHDNLGGMLNPTFRHFSLIVMGLHYAGDAAAIVTLSAIAFGTLFLATRVLARLAAREGRPNTRCALVLGAGSSSFFACLIVLRMPFSALPFIGLGVIAVLAVLWWRQPERRAEWNAHIVLWIFASACCARILLRCSPINYGFYLLPPGLVALGVLLFDYAPRHLGATGWPRRVVEAAGMGFFAGAALAALLASSSWYALHTEELATQRGRLYMLPDGVQAPAVRALSGLPPETRVLAVPEGAGLVFMSGLRSPHGSTFSFLPVESYGSYNDRQILARWKSDPPDVVLLVKRPMPEYGYRGFGIDYAIEPFAWILKNYEPATNPEAGFVLLRRR